MSRLLCALFLHLALIGMAPAARAGIVTVTFEQSNSGAYFQNVTFSGFRFSPYCHIDVLGYLGFDTSGCLSDPAGNPNYLGQPPQDPGLAPVFIDNFDHPFSLLQFDYLGQPGTVVRSSKGGVLVLNQGVNFDGWTTVTLSGSDWNGIRWIELSGGCPGTPCRRFDNMTFRVGEPSTLAVVATPLALLAFRRRRRGLQTPA